MFSRVFQEIWDSVEAHYADLLPYERYMACRQCGIIYYYRKREPELTPKVDKDIRDNIKSTLTLDFSESDLASDAYPGPATFGLMVDGSARNWLVYWKSPFASGPFVIRIL